MELQTNLASKREQIAGKRKIETAAADALLLFAVYFVIKSNNVKAFSPYNSY
jgi:hypothetical protein